MTCIILTVKELASHGPFEGGKGEEPQAHRENRGRPLPRARRGRHRSRRSHERGRPDPWRLLRSFRLPRGASGRSDRVRVADRKSTRLNSSHEWISYAV